MDYLKTSMQPICVFYNFFLLYLYIRLQSNNLLLL
nr:MAG TPA: hypothetical protein [Bacteriophage sp.]